MSSPSKPSKRISPVSIAELSRRRRALLEAGLPEVRKATEDENQLGYRASTTSSAEAEGWLRGLDSLAEHATVELIWTTADGSTGSFQLMPDGALSVESVEGDDASSKALRDLLDSLERSDEIAVGNLTKTFAALDPNDLPVRFQLTLSIAKSAWVEDLLGGEADCNALLFIFSHNFLGALEGASFDHLESKWFATAGKTAVVLLPESGGSLEGDYLACFGGDALAEVDDFLGPRRARDFKRLDKVRALCDKQCRWKAAPKVLTPRHFVLRGRLSGAAAVEISTELTVVAAQLAVAYLADRTDDQATASQSLFYGYKTCRVDSGRSALRQWIRDTGLDPWPLLRLFESTYENQSADQLRITRWLVTDALEEESESNLETLLESAGAIHSSAGDQFEQLMRRNISEYFQARREVLEFLRRYTDEITRAVAELTGELTSNLYKTLGAIVGALVAAKLTEKEALVVLTTALLYLIYVGFILVYLLPAIRGRLDLKKNEYDNNVKQLVHNDLLMENDIERFQGQSFRAAEEMFADTDRRTESIYSVLAGIAATVAVASAVTLLVAYGVFSG